MQIVCENSNPVYWEKIVSSTGELIPLGSSSAPTGAYFQFSSSSCSSTDILAYNGFTYGDLLLTIFSFFTLVLLLYWFFHTWIFGVKVKG